MAVATPRVRPPPPAQARSAVRRGRRPRRRPRPSTRARRPSTGPALAGAAAPQPHPPPPSPSAGAPHRPRSSHGAPPGTVQRGPAIEGAAAGGGAVLAGRAVGVGHAVGRSGVGDHLGPGEADLDRLRAGRGQVAVVGQRAVAVVVAEARAVAGRQVGRGEQAEVLALDVVVVAGRADGVGRAVAQAAGGGGLAGLAVRARRRVTLVAGDRVDRAQAGLVVGRQRPLPTPRRPRHVHRVVRAHGVAEA